jgi:ribonuclease P/MRP protein subunit POP5
MFQIVIDLLILIWLIVLTIYTVRNRNVYIKKISNKRNIRSKRYILFYVVLKEKENINISNKSIEDAIRGSVKELLGNMWLEISNPKIVFYDPIKLQGIISTNRAGYKVVIASLPLVKEINNTKVLIVATRTTGSLKRAKKLMSI